ncbi:MAG: PhzF family phenazine biosynthesis protein, partial [Flavitalea sp.]
LTELADFSSLTKGLNIQPVKALKGKTDYIFIYDKQEDIENLQPDFFEIAKVPARGFIVTARGKDVDFVSRFFGPQSGVNEDPVTGSAHTSLIPYWSKELGKTQMDAMQLSERKGWLTCTYLGDRVEISGKGKTYLIGEIYF